MKVDNIIQVNSTVDAAKVKPDDALRFAKRGANNDMRYLKIFNLDPLTTNLLMAIDENTGKIVRLSGVQFDTISRFDNSTVVGTFPQFIPMTLQVCNAPDQPGGQVIRIKTCEVSGAGHFVDIAGEGAEDHQVNNHILCRLSPPEFWFLDMPTARKYGLA